MRRLVIVVALVAMAVVGSPEPAAASPSLWDRAREGAACVSRYGPGPCADANDASNWAKGMTSAKFRTLRQHNDIADAYRHCAWMGALATRIGWTKAVGIGFLHEELNPGPNSEYLMDTNNNMVGASIGVTAVQRRERDTWGYVSRECEAKARARQLRGLNGRIGNY